MKKLTPAKVEQRVSDTFSLPKDVVLGLFNMHILGNQELILENYKGILKCEEELIVVKTKKSVISINGKNLVIDYYTEREMKVKGAIKQISFE